MKKAAAVILSILLIGFLSLRFLSSENKPAPPNIIYILADDLGYGDLGCYGQQEIQTPKIDEMARDGMMFTSHYAGSTVCAPSRCALMTGFHTGHAYIRNNNKFALRPKDVTIAEKLSDAGYSTALIGKWGLGNPGTTGMPTKQGFDYFIGYMDQGHAHNYYPSFLFRNEERIQLPNVVPDETELGRGIASEKNVYSHDLFTEEALKYIGSAGKTGTPFFLYLAYTIPHANNEAGRKLGDGMEVPDYGIYDERDWPDQQKGHAAMITRLDKDVGRIFDLLESMDIDENTIVFFSSDNGPHQEGGVDYEFNNSNGIYRGYKRDLYEGGIRVPLIVRWPGKIKPDSKSDLISAFWDMFPTFTELAGARLDLKTDGISILPTLLGEKSQKKHEYLYWEIALKESKQAVRKGKWKGIRLNVQEDPDGPVELYNLDEDPSETNNIAEEFPKVVNEISIIMDTARLASENFPLYSN